MFDYAQTHIPIPADPRYPKLRIDCFGKYSVIYVDGVAIGKGVKSVKFEHHAGEAAEFSFKGDVDAVGFYTVEGKENVPGGGSPGTDAVQERRSKGGDETPADIIQEVVHSTIEELNQHIREGGKPILL